MLEKGIENKGIWSRIERMKGEGSMSGGGGQKIKSS
jgi:hypothetical protein